MNIKDLRFMEDESSELKLIDATLDEDVLFDQSDT